MTETFWLIRFLLIDLARASRVGPGSIAGHVAIVGLNLVIAGSFFVLLLRLVLGVTDDHQREALLVVAFVAAALGWTAVQVLLQRPMHWLFDLRPLLILPYGLRHLHRLRLAVGLGGWWIVTFGPALAYLVATTPTSLRTALPISLGIAISVLVQCQLASVLAVFRDRIIQGLVGSAAMLLGMITVYASLAHGFALAAGEIDLENALSQIRDSPVVEVARYTPPGLLAVIVARPEVPLENWGRVAGLLGTFLVLQALDRRLHRWRCLVRPAGDRTVPTRALPLARLFRTLPKLRPTTTLSLIEFETFLRSRQTRWCLLIALAFLIVGTGDPVTGAVAPLLLACLLLNVQRAELLLPTGRRWTESFALPMPVLNVLRAMGRVPTGTLAAFLAAALLIGTGRYGWFGGANLAITVAFGVALILAADGIYGWYDARWQAPPHTTGRDLRSGKTFAQNTIALSLLVPLSLFVVVYTASAGQGTTALAAIAGLSLVVAWLTRQRLRHKQRALLRERGLDLLLGRPSEPQPPGSGA